MNGKGAWDGVWTGVYSYNKCYDGRGHFNPPDANRNNYMQPLAGGEGWMNITFTQNGCDVTGKVALTDNNAGTNPCQVTYTGTASGTELKGTWKAYCDIDIGQAGKHDSGVFDIFMEPGLSNTFIGSFTCDTDTCRKLIAANCPDANSNWVGKRG